MRGDGGHAIAVLCRYVTAYLPTFPLNVHVCMYACMCVCAHVHMPEYVLVCEYPCGA